MFFIPHTEPWRYHPQNSHRKSDIDFFEDIIAITLKMKTEENLEEKNTES